MIIFIMIIVVIILKFIVLLKKTKNIVKHLKKKNKMPNYNYLIAVVNR